MGTALAIIGLITALAPAIISLVQWLLRTFGQPKPLTPELKHEDTRQTVQKIIATGDERGANILVDDMLRRLRKSDEVRSDFGGARDEKS